MILSLGSEVVPGVRVVLSGAELTAGQPWRLEATYADGLSAEVTYRPRGGSGTGAGAQVALVDYAAPIRREVAYRLFVAGVLVALETITRTSPYDNAFTTMNAGLVVGIDWMEDGGDKRQGVRRGFTTDVPGNPYAPLRLAPVAGKGGGSLIAETEGAETRRMRQLLDTNDLAYLLHSCDMPDCDIPLSELVWFTSDGNDRPHGSLPQRAWALSYILTADPEPDLILGVSDWPEFNARWAGKTWAEFNTAMAGKTWDEFNLIDWDSFA